MLSCLTLRRVSNIKYLPLNWTTTTMFSIRNYEMKRMFTVKSKLEKRNYLHRLVNGTNFYLGTIDFRAKNKRYLSQNLFNLFAIDR